MPKFVLNETSYHGYGAINNIVTDVFDDAGDLGG